MGLHLTRVVTPKPRFGIRHGIRNQNAPGAPFTLQPNGTPRGSPCALFQTLSVCLWVCAPTEQFQSCSCDCARARVCVCVWWHSSMIPWYHGTHNPTSKVRHAALALLTNTHMNSYLRQSGAQAQVHKRHAGGGRGSK